MLLGLFLLLSEEEFLQNLLVASLSPPSTFLPNASPILLPAPILLPIPILLSAPVSETPFDQFFQLFFGPQVLFQVFGLEGGLSQKFQFRRVVCAELFP